MKFIGNGLNHGYLRDILPGQSVGFDSVKAAIAYGGGDSELVKNCLQYKRRLDIWMRYDHTVPVKIPLLRKLLSHVGQNIFCYQVPDILHAKVIWWQGYGAYIGSANMTDRAWYSNIEAGLFLSDDDLYLHDMHAQLENFFDGLQNLKEAFPLTKEIIDELEQIQALRKPEQELDAKAKQKRSIPVFDSLLSVDKVSAKNRKKDSFQKEWHEALSYLRDIANRVVDYRPAWVNADTPPAWQADQFLHAYYYNHVRDGHNYPFEDLYQRNRSNPAGALSTELAWWKSLKEPPSSEDVNFEVNAPFIKQALAKDKIDQLSLDDFRLLCGYTHATLEHVKKVSLGMFGITDTTSMSVEDRINFFADWLWQQKTPNGLHVKEVLKEILYSGSDAKMWERLYRFGREDGHGLPHYGLNSLAEVIGWARPEAVPPRNGRTSKALRALGYNVNIY